MIIKAKNEHLATVAQLAAELWPDNSAEEMLEELYQLDEESSVIFLAEVDNMAVGFAQCQLRHDYVEGTDHSPVGYLEGIYVMPGHRMQGLARALVETCKDWARAQGCSEFASDTPLHNVESQAFHQALGFTEAERIVCYTQQL